MPVSLDLHPRLWIWHLVACLVHFVSFLLLTVAIPPFNDFPGAVGPLRYVYTNATNTTTATTSYVYSSWIDSTPLSGVQANEFITFLSHGIGTYVAWTIKNARPVEIRRRWFEYAITAGVLECSLLFVFGVRSFFTFLLVFCLNAALQLTGGLSLDQIRMHTSADFYFLQKITLLAQSFVFVVVQIAFTITTAAVAEGVANSIALSVFYAIFYLSFGVLQTLSHTVQDFDDTFDTDVGFVVLSVTSKLCLSWHVVSVMKNIEYELSAATNVGEQADALHTAVVILYVLSAASVALYFVWPCLFPQPSKYSDIGEV